MRPWILFFLFVFLVDEVSSQKLNIGNSITEVNGKVLDAETMLPLAFTNIAISSKNRGTVSNEDGQFLLNIAGLNLSDTVSFHYIGYKAKRIAISDLINNSVVLLQAYVISINDFIVYGNEIDAKAIVKKVIENKEKNYRVAPLKSRMFVRNRYATDISSLRIKSLKNSFDELDKSTAKMLENSVPKHQLSYTDYYGDVYSNNTDDIDKEDRTKLFPIKIISLRDNEDYTELETTFNALFNDTDEKEYWKVASGVFSTKLTVNGDSANIDTTQKVEDYKNTMSSWFFEKQINRSNEFLSMEDEDNWQFLYETGKYNYTLFGGTRLKGEDVYIIDFVTKGRGDYKGRLYISTSTYAILKAEFQYAEGKSGTDINLLGIAYKETIHKATVFFENKSGNYRLKYMFRQEGERVGFNRNVELIKKRKRFLFDKTIAKYKVKLVYKAVNLNSIEVLVIGENIISKKQFTDFKSKERLKVKYVNEFDENMWKGFSIIAPTDQMKDYRKH
jgi:hypothetical protein